MPPFLSKVSCTPRFPKKTTLGPRVKLPRKKPYSSSPVKQSSSVKQDQTVSSLPIITGHSPGVHSGPDAIQHCNDQQEMDSTPRSGPSFALPSSTHELSAIGSCGELPSHETAPVLPVPLRLITPLSSTSFDPPPISTCTLQPRHIATLASYQPTSVSGTLDENVEYEFTMILTVATLPGYHDVAHAWYGFRQTPQNHPACIDRFMALVDAILRFQSPPPRSRTPTDSDEWNLAFCMKMWMVCPNSHACHLDSLTIHYARPQDIRTTVEAFDTEDIRLLIDKQRNSPKPLNASLNNWYQSRKNCDRFISRAWRTLYDRTIQTIFLASGIKS